jgi:hypothetical protein
MNKNTILLKYFVAKWKNQPGWISQFFCAEDFSNSCKAAPKPEPRKLSRKNLRFYRIFEFASRTLATKIFIASSERAWKNKPVGRLMLYSISSSSEVIRKNVQNINCWFSTMCDIISWVSMFTVLNSKLKHSSVIMGPNQMKFCILIVHDETHWKTILTLLPR